MAAKKKKKKKKKKTHTQIKAQGSKVEDCSVAKWSCLFPILRLVVPKNTELAPKVSKRGQLRMTIGTKDGEETKDRDQSAQNREQKTGSRA